MASGARRYNRSMPRLLMTVFALLVVAVAGGIGYLASRDPNDFKPELEALVRDQTGLAVELGTLDWRLWPPLAIEAREISAAYPGAPRLIAAARLSLDLRILPLLSLDPHLVVRGIELSGMQVSLSRDAAGHANWQARDVRPARVPTQGPPAQPATSARPWALPLVLGPLHVDGGIEFNDMPSGRTWRFEDVVLETDGRGPGGAIPMRLSFDAHQDGGARLGIQAGGDLTLPDRPDGEVVVSGFEVTGSLQPAQDRSAEPLEARIPKASYDLGHGRLDIREFQATLAARTLSPSIAADSAPIQASGRLSAAFVPKLQWEGEAEFDTLPIAGYELQAARLTISGEGVRADGELDARLLEGQLGVTLEATLGEPPAWQLTAQLRDIDGKTLVHRLAPGWQFEGRLRLDAELRATGSDAAAIADSVSGPVRFDGGQGRLDVRGIKAQAAALASLAGRGQAAAKWPDVLDYSRLTGTLELEGLDALAFNGALDNLIIEGDGGYDLARNEVDLQATLTVEDDPRYHSFDVNEYLVGIPVPVRCSGPLDGSGRLCRLNAERAQDVIAQALTGAGGSKVRERLERTIDEKLPEQFRDAAKSFLDLLERSRSGEAR